MKEVHAATLLVLASMLPLASDAAPCRAVTGVATPITVPGRYCLTRDIVSATGHGILIRANHVTLDFAGHKLSTPVRTTTAGHLRFGVDASNNHTITIMNGTLQGFNDGIVLGEHAPVPNPGNYVVTNMRILDMQTAGRSVGIFEATGSNVTITNNVISNITGGQGNFAGDAFGMMIHGASGTSSLPGKIVIKGNRVDHVVSTPGGGNAEGILVETDNEGLITGNMITEIIAGATSFQNSIGLNVIAIPRDQPGLAEVGGNYVWNSVRTANSTGIRVNNGLTNAVIRDSTVGGYNTGLELGGACVPFYRIQHHCRRHRSVCNIRDADSVWSGNQRTRQSGGELGTADAFPVSHPITPECRPIRAWGNAQPTREMLSQRVGISQAASLCDTVHGQGGGLEQLPSTIDPLPQQPLQRADTRLFTKSARECALAQVRSHRQCRQGNGFIQVLARPLAGCRQRCFRLGYHGLLDELCLSSCPGRRDDRQSGSVIGHRGSIVLGDEMQTQDRSRPLRPLKSPGSRPRRTATIRT